jgi:hypothetical protein
MGSKEDTIEIFLMTGNGGWIEERRRKRARK